MNWIGWIGLCVSSLIFGAAGATITGWPTLSRKTIVVTVIAAPLLVFAWSFA